MTATIQSQNLDELIKAAELHHEQYMRTLRSLQDAVAPRRRERSDSRATGPEPFTPPMRALSGPMFITDTQPSSLPMLRRARRSTLEGFERPNFSTEPPLLSSSPNSNNGVVVHDDFIPLLELPGTTLRATENAPAAPHLLLTPMHFDDSMLLRYLKEADFPGEMSHLLEDVLKRREEIDMAVPFQDFAAYEREDYHVTSTFEVYEVDRDGTATKLSEDLDLPPQIKYSGDVPYEGPEGIVDAPTVWEAIKDVNADAQSVGRITIIQEPTPLMLAALHLTMSLHFDMSELLAHLLNDTLNRGRTLAFMNRAYERIPSASTSPYPSSPTIRPIDVSNPQPLQSSFGNLRQRSFFFVFKYYTVVGEGLKPAPWQRYDERPVDKRLGDHIDIAECSSVLALSLGGQPTKSLKMRSRRVGKKEGFLFDTFGPWQLLSIQSFPDEEHTVRGEEFQNKSFVNGPYAFLNLLVAEYRDAGKRNQILHDRIKKLITPPPEFMFDPRLRDKLLFEDKHFTYIRRYFWAFNTLAVVNNGIKAMIDAYVDNFDDNFWAGSHSVLWPHEAPDSPEGIAYRERMAALRTELEKVVRDLGEVQKRNERTRKEIENLRDQLFSGSSIKESRRAIEQGDNIRILTMISMIFLPLTFVTSVFGMTMFDIPATDWRFVATMILVCVPFMLLISLLQTRTFTKLVDKLTACMKYIIALPAALLVPKAEPPDPRVVPARPPPRGRKRRLRADGEGLRGGVRWWRWKLRWPWLRKRVAPTEEIDLGRV